MHAKIAKWGNSLGVRLPASIAHEMGLKEGTEIRLTADAKAIKLVPIKSPARKFTLGKLLSGITPENQHGETDFGPDVGAEVIE
jgi:antitoxin MazE